MQLKATIEPLFVHYNFLALSSVGDLKVSCAHRKRGRNLLQPFEHLRVHFLRSHREIYEVLINFPVLFHLALGNES